MPSIRLAPFALVVTLAIPPWTASADPLAAAARSFLSGDYHGVMNHLPPPAKLKAEGALLHANTLMELGRHEAALRELRRARAGAPHIADLIYFHEGRVLLTLKRYKNAAAAFRQSMRATPSRFVDSARQLRGDALRLAGRHTDAVKEYTELLKSWTDHPSTPRLKLSRALSNGQRKRQRADAAKELLEVWLKWPAHPAADEARAELDKLAKEGVKPEPPSVDDLLGRARRLRRVKEFERAIAELEALRKQFPDSWREIDYTLATTYRKADRPQEQLEALQRLYDDAVKSKRVPRLLRWKLAKSLAWTGQVDKAVVLCLEGVPDKPRRQDASRLRAAITLLERHARYKQAYAMTQRLASVTSARAVRGRLAWLAYRSGDYDAAIAGFKAMVVRRKDRAWLLYWQARAHVAAGREETGVGLYKELLEKHLRSYYGQLARSRLQEMGKLELEPRSCPTPSGRRSKGTGDALSAAIERYGELLPELARARSLWRVGMEAEAQRELRVMAMDLTYALYLGRNSRYRVRPWVERVWRGTEAPNRRWLRGKRAKKLRALKRPQRAEMLDAVSDVLQKAGVFYFGWRLAGVNKNDVRSVYPRAYLPMAVEVAKRYDLDPNLIWAIMRTESSYRADAISRVYAGGLMQLMPHTAVRLAGELKMYRFEPSQVFDPWINLTLAGHYLRALWSKFNGQLPLIAASYNGGPHNVARWLAFRGNKSAMDEFVEEIPLRESRRYGKKIVRLVSLYERTYCSKDDRVVPNRLNPRFTLYPSY